MNEVAAAPQEDRTLAMITHLSGIVEVLHGME